LGDRELKKEDEAPLFHPGLQTAGFGLKRLGPDFFWVKPLVLYLYVDRGTSVIAEGCAAAMV
jgi:hypothetical protein